LLVLTAACTANVEPPAPSAVATASGVHDGTGAVAPSRLACPSSVRDGDGCGAPLTCEDDACGRYACAAGKWTRLDGDSPCRTATLRNDCPIVRPSEGDWCSASATCTFDDTCSQRPSGVEKVTLRCNGYDWSLVSRPYEVVCPSSAPRDGDPCEPSCAYPSCTYGCGTATCDATTATWKIEGC